MPGKYERKTDRIYGEKMGRIRELCRKSPQISAPDLVCAGLASDGRYGNILLHYLHKRGELRLVRPGIAVRNRATPAVYTAQGLPLSQPQDTRPHENN